jgi:hypothetical protein
VSAWALASAAAIDPAKECWNSRKFGTRMRIQAAFEKAGILFIADDEIAGIGVRLAKKKRGR